MASDSSSDVKFEIGHVLFIDIVGYSKGLIDEQSESLRKLKEIVRDTEQFRIADAEGKLLRLPTGDGGALVFRNTPEAPVLCALEITRELQKYPGSMMLNLFTVFEPRPEFKTRAISSRIYPSEPTQAFL